MMGETGRSGTAVRGHRRWIWGGVAAVAVCAILLGALGSALAAPSPAAKVVTGTATSFATGKGPDRMAYNPVNHDLYVPDQSASVVQIFNSTNARVATVHLPVDSYPSAAAFYPRNNGVYVTAQGANVVFVITGTKLTHTISSSFFNSPYGIVYDPGDAAMIVANDGGNTVTAIVGTTAAYTIPVGSNPFEIAYDPYYSTLVVTNFYSANITILDAVYLTHIGSEPVGTEPTGVAYDPVNQRVYVANFGSDNVTVTDGYLSQVGTLGGLSNPDGIAFSQASLEIYITNVHTGKVFVYNSADKLVAKYSTTAKANPVDATYDEYNDLVYVSGYYVAKVFVVP